MKPEFGAMRHKQTIAVAIPLILMLGVFLFIITPALVSNAIQSTIVDALRHDFGLTESCYIRIDSGTIPLLYGRIDQIYIECHESKFDGIKTQSAFLFLRDVKFDLKSSFSDRGAKIKSIERVTARMALDESEINRYLTDNLAELSGWNIDLRPNKIIAKADIDMVGGLKVTFTPRLKGDHLTFEPVAAEFKKIHNIGLREAKSWVREIPINVPIDRLPFGMKVAKILVHDDQLIITARN